MFASRPSPNASRGYFIALTATLLWSFTGVLISYLNRTYALPSLMLAFWRDLAVAAGLSLFFFVFTPARFRLAREQWPFMAIFAFVVAVFNSARNTSISSNSFPSA